MMQQMPMMMAMPMMMGMGMPMMGATTQARSVSYERPREDCCSESERRLDDLDDRVDALDMRMQTIQRAVEIQTRILEEIKAQGTIGKTAIPSA